MEVLSFQVHAKPAQVGAFIYVNLSDERQKLVYEYSCEVEEIETVLSGEEIKAIYKTHVKAALEQYVLETGNSSYELCNDGRVEA